jgi:transcriptional regulator with XRE-family HTH domain
MLVAVMTRQKSLTREERRRALEVLDEVIAQHPSQNAVARAIGLSQQLVSSVAKREDPPGPKLAAALEKLTGKKILRTPEELAADLAAEKSPEPPPTGPRLKVLNTTAFPEVVEEWFQAAFRLPGYPRYTGKQILVAKVFMRERQARMPEHPDMVGLCMAALEAARRLDAKGELGDPADEATSERVLHELVSPVIPQVPADDPLMLALAEADAQNEADENPYAGGKPTAPATPRASSKKQ